MGNRYPYHEDTIAAISTPVGRAGIGIVRLSGSQSAEIAKKVFRPRRLVTEFQTHRLYLGHLIDPETGDMIDEVLLSYMMAPHSYTAEDVVEINSHSGHFILSRILQVIHREGARPARPGEFTFRAFMNGRMDLTQAEAIVDLINAKSEKGLHLAALQMGGQLRDRVERLKQKVMECLAQLEVAMDFPEEAGEILPKEEMNARMEVELIGPLERLIEAHSQRKIWMEGIGTAIVGRVNAGKSSLLNVLLNEERAIVTPIPGTTRDVIESTVHIDGIPLRLMDTAGIREVEGEIERMGIQRAEKKLSEAELVLVVIDRSRPMVQDDKRILSRAPEEKSIVVVNKIDLPSKLDEKDLRGLVQGRPLVPTSALTGEGIDDLREAIKSHVTSETRVFHTSGVVPNLRQKIALEDALRYFQQALGNRRQDMPDEIIAMDLASGLESLGEIIGETTPDQVLEKIFREFCIGK